MKRSIFIVALIFALLCGTVAAQTSVGITNQNFTAAATSVSTTLAGVTAGSTIIVGCISNNTTFCTVSDGSAYTPSSPSGTDNTTVNGRTYIYYLTNASVGTHTITATASASAAIYIWAIEVMGANTSQPIDKSACGFNASSTSISGPTINNVDAGNTVFAMAGAEQTITAAGGSFTLMPVQNGNGAEYQANVAGGTYSATFTQSPAGVSTACIISVAAAAQPADDASVVMDFSGGSNGTQWGATDLQNGTHCGNGSWTVTGGAADTYVTTPTQSFRANKKACGVAYLGNTGITTKALSPAAGVIASYFFTPLASTGRSCAGMFWRTDLANTASSISTMVHFNIQATNTGFAAVSLSRSVTGQLALDLEYSNAGTANHTSTINISNNTWYWVTLCNVPGGLATMQVYETATWTQLGSTLTAAVNAPAGVNANINIGHAGAGADLSTVYLSNIVLDYITGALIPPGVPANTEQTHFRFRNDNGSETTATWLAAQDTNVTQPLSTATRLRVQVDSVGDVGATQFQLEYKKSSDTLYSVVPTTTTTTSTITRRSIGAKVNGTTTCVATEPAATVAGDVYLAFIGDHATTGTSTAPTGWTNIASAAATGGRIQVFRAIKGAGGLTGTSWSWGATGTALTTRSICQIIAYANVDNTTPIDVTSTARSNASGTTGAATLTTVTNGAMVVAGFVGLATGNTWSAEAVATSPTLTEFTDSANSTFSSLAIADGLKATAGATGASSGTMSVAGANGGAIVALRPVIVTNPIVITASANIAASAATATTTQESVPNAHSFTACRIADDTNPMPSLTPATDNYSECEWNLNALTPAVNGDVYQFRMTLNGVPFTTYTANPQWTIGTAGVAIIPRHRGMVW